MKTLEDIEREVGLFKPPAPGGGVLGIGKTSGFADVPPVPRARTLEDIEREVGLLPEISVVSSFKPLTLQDIERAVGLGGNDSGTTALTLEDIERQVGLAPRNDISELGTSPRDFRPAVTGAERYEHWAGNIPRGFAQSVSSLIRVGDWLFESGKMKEYADRLEEAVRSHAPDDPGYLDDAASGLGSMIFYLLPGLVAAKGVSALAKVSPMVARITGAGFSGGFEALNSGASVFRDVMEKTGDRDQAYKQGWKAFAAEVPMDALTNLPLFGAMGKGGALGRMASTAIGQSAQEAGQSVISQYFTDGDVNWREAAYEGAASLPASLIMGGGAVVTDPAGHSRGSVDGDVAVDPSLDAEADIEAGGGADAEWPQKGDFNTSVERGALADAMREAGGLNWDSILTVYGQDFMSPLVKQFPSEEFPGLWKTGNAGLRFADMATALQEKGMEISNPRDLHRIMSGDPAAASARIDEKITYGFKHQDERSILQKAGDAGRKFYDHVFDREAPVQRLVERAKKSGQDVAPGNDPYLHLGQLRNVHGAINQDLDQVRNILGELSRDDHEGLSRLLVAYRSLDQRNLGIPVKVTPGDALLEIENADPRLKKAQQDLVVYQKGLLWKLVESGHLNYRSYQTLVNKWPNYAPFFLDGGFDFMESFNAEPGKVFNDKAALQLMEGTEEAIHDPLESIVKNTSAVNRMVRENQVAKDLLEMSKIPDMEGVLEEVTDPAKARRMEGVVTVWEGGKRRYLKTLPDVFNVLKDAPGKYNIFFQTMKVFSRTLRQTAVQHNPMFLVLNPIRDMFTGVISSETGLLPGEIHLKGLKHVLGKSDLYAEALREGALGGHFIAQDKKGVSQDVRDMFSEGQEAEGRKGSNPLRWVGGLNDLLEQAPRMAEYASMRGDPSIRDALLKAFGRDFKIYSVEEASQSARDLSVDFSRFGQSTRIPNDTIAFFNAALQGMKKIKDMSVKHPARTFARGVLWITLPSVLLWLRNHDEPWYQELPQTEKDRWWHVMIGDRIYRVIKPFEMGLIFGSVAERSMEQFANENPAAFRNFSESLIGSLGPAYLPTMFGPIIEWQTNYNLFRDRQIVPMREQGLLPEYQFGPETSEVGKWIGGRLGVSPRKIDNTIYGYTSKLGRYATDLVDIIVEQAGGRKSAPREWTLDDLVRDPGGTLQKAFSRQPYRNPQSIEDFYEEYARLDSLYRTMRASEKPLEGFNGLKYQLLKRVNGELSDIWAARRAVLEDESLSGKQKQEAIERLTFLAMNLARLGTGKTIVKESGEQTVNPFRFTR